MIHNNAASNKQREVTEQLLLYYHQSLPESQPRHQLPSIKLLMEAAFDDSEPVFCAARVLLQKSLDIMPADELTALATECGEFYNFPIPIEPVFAHDRARLDADITAEEAGESHNEAISDRELKLCMVLILIGMIEMSNRKRIRRAALLKQLKKQPGDSSSDDEPDRSTNQLTNQSSPAAAQLTEFEAKSQYLTFTLLRAIAAPVAPGNTRAAMLTALACDLLYKSMNYLRVHITQPVPLMRRLLAHSLSSDRTLAQAAHRALIECGRVAPALFLECVSKEAHNVRNPTDVRQSAIASLVSLIKAHPQSLAKVLALTVSTCVKWLDPANAAQRKILLHSATAALYSMVQNYPSCSFHQQSQRFAVGTGISQQCVIVVYDLRTATVWRLLEGHGSEINALAFSKDEEGVRLVSYSALESPAPSVRLWNTEQGGFLSGLIGMSGKCVRVVRLDRVDHQQMARQMRLKETERLVALAKSERRRRKRRAKAAKEGFGKDALVPFDSPSQSPLGEFSPSSSPLTSFDSPLTLPRASSAAEARVAALPGVAAPIPIPIQQPHATLRRLPPPKINGSLNGQRHSPVLGSSMQISFGTTPETTSYLGGVRTATPPLLFLDDSDVSAGATSALSSSLPENGVISNVRVSLLSRMLAITITWTSHSQATITREDGSISLIDLE